MRARLPSVMNLRLLRAALLLRAGAGVLSDKSKRRDMVRTRSGEAADKPLLMVRPRPSRIQAGGASGFAGSTYVDFQYWTPSLGGDILGPPWAILTAAHRDNFFRAPTQARRSRPAPASRRLPLQASRARHRVGLSSAAVVRIAART